MRHYVVTFHRAFPFVAIERVYPFIYMSEVPDTADATYATEVQKPVRGE